MPTMIDIAQRSGVAVSTVSYALSGKRPVSAETRERVQRAIDDLGFRPHEPARALKSRSSRTVSLFSPYFRDGFDIEGQIFLSGIVEATSEFDYGLLVSTSTPDPGDIVATLENGRADGVILMEVRLADERVKRLRSSGYPFCIIGRTADNDGIDFVDYDFEEAVSTAVRHLHELGHRRVALLNRAPSLVGADYGPTVRSQTAFETATRELSVQGDHLFSGTGDEHYRDVLQFLERSPNCTAAITLSVTYAPLLAALRHLGRRVPDDFSIVAIMTSLLADLVTPRLTTIDLPALEMGRRGAEIMIRRLSDPDLPPAQMLLRGSLHVRSSAPPPEI
jgi:DNA-binding LacI/PurR family transcriptional regulator